MREIDVYYALSADFAFSGPHRSLLAIPVNTIHIRTAEQWVEMFDALESVAAAYPGQVSYYCITGMQAYALGIHANIETAEAMGRQIHAAHQSAVDTLAKAMRGELETWVPSGSIPPLRLFTAGDIPNWREQLTALISRDADATQDTPTDPRPEPA